MTNKELLKVAEDAIETLFADISVSISKTMENLEELQSDIEAKLEALDCDLKSLDDPV